MSHTAVAAAEEVLDRHFDLPEIYDPAVPLTVLVESGHNARRRFDQGKLDELAASIREKGIIEPLVVRPFPLNGDTKYEIVAGARRYRASKLAGRTTVPCVIREYTDTDVIELQIAENIQREGLDPIDEALSYKTLIDFDSSRYTAAYIAQRIGRKEAYVWETIRLLNLVDQAKQLLEDGRITRSHGEAIARLTADQQTELIDPESDLWRPERGSLPLDEQPGIYDDKKPISIRELEHHIAHHIRFDVRRAAEIAPLDYSETAARVEAAMAKPGRGKKVISITHLHQTPANARDENDRTYTAQSWARADGRADSHTCEFSILGMIAVGPGQGEAFDVCIAKDKCDVHWKAERRAKEKTEKLKASGQTEKAKQVFEEQREKQAEQQRKADEARKRWNAATPAIIDAIAAAMKKARPGAIGPLVLKAIDGSYNEQFGKVARARIPAKHRADDIVRQAALIVLIRELSGYNAHERFPRLAKSYGVDIAAILKAQQKQQKAKVKK